MLKAINKLKPNYKWSLILISSVGAGFVVGTFVLVTLSMIAAKSTL